MEQEFAIPLCLADRGNAKVGRVWTFSLPSFLTCPGASPWCREHCYAWRFEKVRPNCRRAYIRNLALSLEPERFVTEVLGTLPEDAPLVRVHVGGDWYSSEYATSWLSICQARPHTLFWAYTRAWSVAALRPALEQLRALSNVNVFASTDPQMPPPPEGWRAAFIDIDPRASGMPCRHQQGEVDSCLECGYCFREDAGNVVFKVH
jgi:Gene product 88